MLKYFPWKTGFDISIETICMKCQILYSANNNDDNNNNNNNK